MKSVVLFILYLSYLRGQEFQEADLNVVRYIQTAFCGQPRGGCNNSPSSTTTDWSGASLSLDDLPVPVPNQVPFSCCIQCSCNTTTCADYGTCCPEVLDYLPSVQESERVIIPAACGNTAVKGIQSTQSIWLFGLCSPDYLPLNPDDIDTQSRCEHAEDYIDFETHQPVIDPARDRTYTNKFCALCNFANELNLIPLEPHIRCYDGNSFQRNVNLKTLVRDVRAAINCDLEFDWPFETTSLRAKTCRSLFTQCNVTGKWKRYDPVIEAACHAYRSDYDIKYHNVFCYLCNEITSKDSCNYLAQKVDVLASFSALLDFNNVGPGLITSSTPTGNCESSEVYDHFKGVCREITCIFPRINRDGQCVNVARTVTDVAYRLQVKFVPDGIHDADEMFFMAQMVADYTYGLTDSWKSQDAIAENRMYYKFAVKEIGDDSPESIMETTTLWDKNELGNNDESTTSIPKRLERGVQPDTPPTTEAVTLDGLERSVPDLPAELPGFPTETGPFVLGVDYILWQTVFYFSRLFGGEHSVEFIDNILQIDKTNVSVQGIEFSLSLSDYQLDEVSDPIDPDDGMPLPMIDVGFILPSMHLLNPIISPIQLIKNTLVCPLVEINKNEFNISESNTGIYLEEMNTTFSRTFYNKTTMDNMTTVYSICKDTYVSVTDRYISNITPPELIPNNEVTPQGILSLVCACISIVCALITFITYLIFSELRTQPGINNMLVSVYLIFAQSLFIFAAPQSDVVSETACSVIGALVHLFWLMVVFGMNVCCYHMFTVFIGRLRSRDKNSSNIRKSVVYTMYCVLASLLFVAVNIIIVTVDSDQEENGYGGTLCYITRPEMIGYVFALPLGLVLIINIVFFITVIIKISRSPSVSSSNKKDRNYMKIYAKLSTVTGLTWLFGFLFEFTDQVVFEYLFIIFNGGIGFLIFLSFMCNKRIYGLYKRRLFRTVPPKGTTSGKSTNTKDTEMSSNSPS